MTARRALAGNQPDWRMPGHPARPPARHPYLIMNPKPGGGKVEKSDLKRKAEDPGAEVFLIGGPEPAGVAKAAREAAGRGAGLPGVAGGDGTQALVAGITARTRSLTCCKATAEHTCTRKPTARRSRHRRRCWHLATHTEPGTSPARARARGWTTATPASSASRWRARGRPQACSAAGTPPG